MWCWGEGFDIQVCVKFGEDGNWGDLLRREGFDVGAMDLHVCGDSGGGGGV